MKVKSIFLEWYALSWDFNQNKVRYSNVLLNREEDIAREVRSGRVHNKSILKTYLRTALMYDYWSKAEAEFYISDLGGNEFEKVDIWKQLEPNLDLIVEYVNTKMELKLK